MRAFCAKEANIQVVRVNVINILCMFMVSSYTIKINLSVKPTNAPRVLLELNTTYVTYVISDKSGFVFPLWLT
jgi:hypothetical protein